MNKILLVMGLALMAVGALFLAFSLTLETVEREEADEIPHMEIPESPTFTRLTSTNILLSVLGCALMGIGLLIIIESTRVD